MVWLVCNIYECTKIERPIGTRWLARWDKEVDLLVKLVYYGFTTGRGVFSVMSVVLWPIGSTATQTLGEEYTDIWQYSSNYVTPPSSRARVGVILLPTLLAYFLGRWGSTSFGERYPFVGMLLKTLPVGLETLAEINLAIFYLRGTYYSIVKRLFGIRHVRLLWFGWLASQIALAIYNSRKSAYQTTILCSTWNSSHCQTRSSFDHNHSELSVWPPTCSMDQRKGKSCSCRQFTRNFSWWSPLIIISRSWESRGPTCKACWGRWKDGFGRGLNSRCI